MYRPTIFIQANLESQSIQKSDIARSWAGSVAPRFTVNFEDKPDVAFLHADSVEDLLHVLPTLLQLHSESIPTLLLCDNQEHLEDLTVELDITIANTEIKGEAASGILFGMLQREEELAILRSKVGLMSTLRTSLQEDIDQLNDDLTSAAVLQQEFMSTHTDPVHGLYFNTLWHPTGVVSGDMYDITKLDDDHISFFLADAIGHGIPAAMLAMAIAKALAGCRKDRDGNFNEPSAVLNALNHSILDRNATTARFATAMYGVINCKTRTLKIAGAGHPSALWFRESDTPTLLDSKGPLLGIFPDAEFPSETISLGNNDRVLFYSDGFEDALCTNDEASDLPAHIRSFYNIGTKNKNIVAYVEKYLEAKKSHHDDLTMLCLHAPSHVVNLAA
jgi:serine phosphatase RsbU (regulator of sigma subunit)